MEGSAKKHIIDLIRENKWQDFVVEAPTSEVSNILGFKEGMKVAYSLLYNDEWDESLQKYAAELIEALKKEYNEDWSASWKNEAFLGAAYDIILDYDKRYVALDNALRKVKEPPPELLVKLSLCYHCPGKPPISADDAISLAKKSMEMVIYKDAISALILVYSSLDDNESVLYWKNYLDKNREKLEQSPDIVPDCLQT